MHLECRPPARRARPAERRPRQRPRPHRRARPHRRRRPRRPRPRRRCLPFGATANADRAETVTGREAIADLVHRYADRLDAGDLDGVAALFADATYGRAGGPLRRGAAEVRAALNVVRLHDGTPRTKHVTTNLVVEVDEAAGTATARSYFTVFQATPRLPLQPIIAGRYDDRFRHANGGWRFSERIVHMDLIGELGEHLAT